ncbi:beta strand repeat-containing protein [Saccharothrix saharensis]|uniref:beta strand repeat-containing protein n=1 Tax=Saccharothrix saharensis TaxID=571190 RepID=UPI0036B78A08
MQTWAKRGLKTALVTGGLLMLGTGIASAQENVNPDAKPNPLDAKVRVPVDVDHNTLGTPVGSHELPTVHQEIGTPSATGRPVRDLTLPDNPLVRATQERLTGVDTVGLARGNTADADVVVPVSACGNAVAAGGDAYTEGVCAQSASSTGQIRTDGSRGTLAGNVAHAAAAVSPQVNGNAVAALANAESRATSYQRAVAGDEIRTSGEDGSLSGNIAAVQGALPAQVTNNAVAAGGNSRSGATTANDAQATGSLSTTGRRGTGGGNVLGAPVAPVLAVTGNGVGAVGNADTSTENRASSDAGTTHRDRVGTTMWSQTNGDDGTLAGNVVQPAFAGPVAAGDNALAGSGNAQVANAMAHHAEAGGNSYTSGQDAVLSGTFADAPVALPVSGAGNALSGVGTTSARHGNEATAVAGGDTFSSGDRSVLSANSANLPPAGAVDLCGNGLAGGGIADAECRNDVAADSGGYNGTTGNDAVGSGNIGQVPLGAPAEAFGNGVGAAGTPTGRATENKTVRSGRYANSIDDNGTVSSNVVSAPTALGGQVFGNSGGAVANPTSVTDSDTEIDLGNPPKANGKHGSVSGNIVHVPTSNPAQVFGDSVVAVGNGSSDTDSKLDSRSGGTAITTGDEGSLSGNVLSLPEASSPQVFGSAVGAGSNVESESRNQFGSYSGGDVQTSGDDGSFSGNGIGAQPSVPLQVFGDAVTAAGNGSSVTDNRTGLIAGGEHLTSAEDSAWSGNLLTAPTGVTPSVHGDAVTVAGLADAATASRSTSQSGGKTTTSGRGPVSTHDLEVPTEAFARLFGVPVDVLGTATANAQDRNDVRTGDDKGDDTRVTDASRGIQLPAGVDSLLRVTELPNLGLVSRLSQYTVPLGTPGLNELRGLPIQGLRQAQLPGSALLGRTVPRPDVDAINAAKPKAGNPVGAVSQAKLPTAEGPVGALSQAELPTLDGPVGALSQAKLPSEGPLGALSQVELPTQQLPRLADLEQVRQGLPAVGEAARAVTRTVPVVSTLVRAVRSDDEERSFGGTLPVLGDLAPTQPLPAVDGLPVDGLAEGGRTVSSLPVAAPAGLPFVLPVPGVAQPRTQSPIVPPMALSGMNVNPLQGGVGPTRFTETQAPALAAMDARTVFSSLEDTTVIPRI